MLSSSSVSFSIRRPLASLVGVKPPGINPILSNTSVNVNLSFGDRCLEAILGFTLEPLALYTIGNTSVIPPPPFNPNSFAPAAKGSPPKAPYADATVPNPPISCCPKLGGGGAGARNCVVCTGAPVTTA